MCMSTVMHTCSQAEQSCYNWANGQLGANTAANAAFLSLDVQLLTMQIVQKKLPDLPSRHWRLHTVAISFNYHESF